MLESKLSRHINEEFRFLALSTSGLAAGGLLCNEADRMSSLTIVLTGISLGLPIDGNLCHSHTMTGRNFDGELLHFRPDKSQI